MQRTSSWCKVSNLILPAVGVVEEGGMVSGGRRREGGGRSGF